MKNHIARRRLAAMTQKVAYEWIGVHAPVFNLREIAKNMILLEDHLTHDYKYCPDCIRKHFLTIEALADEAISLNPTDKEMFDKITALLKTIRTWETLFANKVSPLLLASQIRTVRKALVPQIFDPCFS
jgi:hypothetical protein